MYYRFSRIKRLVTTGAGHIPAVLVKGGRQFLLLGRDIGTGLVTYHPPIPVESGVIKRIKSAYEALSPNQGYSLSWLGGKYVLVGEGFNGDAKPPDIDLTKDVE